MSDHSLLLLAVGLLARGSGEATGADTGNCTQCSAAGDERHEWGGDG